MAKLYELAKTIRSKNAGVDHITFDIIFDDRKLFEQVVQSGVISRETVSQLYEIPIDRISHFFIFEPANAFKFSITRIRPAGGPGESDVFGCQQYGPLFELEVPVSRR
ncbi:DUF4387 domain-containing protein [Candidatus Entotheonella serta]|nr:DUF4387 domain-containing protein [Candidatus Entotheonella serta]